uniref:Protein F37C4.5 n=1 Tax=Lygus hesperus TaxID=30085 RepID=A0A0A9Y9Y2_LYGHE
MSVYTIAGLATVKSDNNAVKVTITRQALDMALKYISVPKLDPAVYALVRAMNATPFDLLPGTASVFYDNTFVNTSHMTLVPSKALIYISLGADEAVKVTRTLVRRVESSGRVFFSLKKYFECSYVFDVESKLATRAVDLILRDHYPRSVDDDLYI